MKPTKINRRKFIQYTAAISGGVSLSPILRYPAATQQRDSQPQLYWYNRPLRILQTVLREPDATNYDANAVVAYMEIRM